MPVIFPPATGGGGEGGVTDHGALTGLGDDDHTQYLNNARGDVRYYGKSATDSLLDDKADTDHVHIGEDVALDSDTDYVSYFTINDDGTATAGWPDRMRVIFNPQAGADVTTFTLNEYGEIRNIPAKSNTVGYRVFVGTDPTAFAARDVSVPVWEVSSDRTNRVTQVAAYGDGDFYIGKDLAVDGEITAVNVNAGVMLVPEGTSVPGGLPDTLWVEYTP